MFYLPVFLKTELFAYKLEVVKLSFMNAGKLVAGKIVGNGQSCRFYY